MKEITLETPAIIEDAEKKALDNRRKQMILWTTTLYLSVVAGILCAATGLILGAISYIGLFVNADAVNQIGNFMIIIAFPLMMLAAHALDKLNDLKSGKHQP